ncbi:MAG: hypothetical protein ALECFALPRED_001689 [Alectoria fallacina]|uniref:Uncharacterized protein n=1 Tax=Alectoria fallacina TaxID=1903189 RepID=A0A8H3IMT9_9LECA|nr:MAG: hypothetical protein ALECFALPRED_001689 [Alectoria fallacina]
MTIFSLYTTILFHRRFFYCLPAQILPSPLYWKHVRRIELDLGPTQLSHLFNVPRDRRVGDSAQSCLDGVATQFQIWVNERRLQRALIRFPNVRQGWRDWKCDLTVCQKVFCLRIWAGVRVVLRSIPTIEMRGHLDEKQKQEWSKDLALERKGVASNLEELKGWQSQIWGQQYVDFRLYAFVLLSSNTHGSTAPRRSVTASPIASSRTHDKRDGTVGS